MSCFDPTTSILAGMDTTDLQARLTALQSAYLDLSAGAKVVTVSYAQGNGNKSVTYKAADLSEVVSAIRLVQAQLGVVCHPRRALRPLF